jgi:hypothetical protein
VVRGSGSVANTEAIPVPALVKAAVVAGLRLGLMCKAGASSSASARARRWVRHCMGQVVVFAVEKVVSATFLFLLDQCGRGRGGSASLFLLGLLLPFEGACPILVLILIELRFPPAYWLFTGGACMVFGVASHAIAVFNVVKELALKFACDQLAINGSGKVGSLEAGRERGR